MTRNLADEFDQSFPDTRQALDREEATDNGDYEHGEKVGPGRLATVEAALSFIMAGNATVTLRSQKTGTRFTYKIRKADPNPAYPGSVTYFVSLLAGPDNESDFTYLGILRDNQFRTTAKSRLSLDAPSVKAFRWTYERLVRREFPDQLEMWHEGRCGRCNRKLTVPSSIELGIGPECAGKMGL